jgi:hypothetical protein
MPRNLAPLLGGQQRRPGGVNQKETYRHPVTLRIDQTHFFEADLCSKWKCTGILLKSETRIYRQTNGKKISGYSTY